MTVLEIILTAAIAIFAGMTWKVYTRIEWLTGAMEIYSFLMLRLEAKNQGVKTTWWDKTIADWLIRR